MSFRGLYSLVKDGYAIRRPDIGSIIKRDADVPASKRRSGDSPSELTTGSAEGGQRSLLFPRAKRLNPGSRVLKSLFGERADIQDNNSQDTLPQTQSPVSISSSASNTDLEIGAEGRGRRDPVVAPLNNEPCDFPPPYAQGPALPPYEIVVEDEWRRIRSLRRRALDHTSNTETSWCRPTQQREWRRREWSSLHE